MIANLAYANMQLVKKKKKKGTCFEKHRAMMRGA